MVFAITITILTDAKNNKYIMELGERSNNQKRHQIPGNRKRIMYGNRFTARIAGTVWQEKYKNIFLCIRTIHIV